MYLFVYKTKRSLLYPLSNIGSALCCCSFGSLEDSVQMPRSWACNQCITWLTVNSPTYTSTKLYSLMTEAMMHKQFVNGHSWSPLSRGEPVIFRFSALQIFKSRPYICERCCLFLKLMFIKLVLNSLRIICWCMFDSKCIFAAYIVDI